MIRAATLLIFLAFPSFAQDWATAEVCTVDEAKIDASVFDPPGLALLETEASGIENGIGRFWQITSPDGQVSHLWGTYHSADPLMLDLPEQVIQTINAARVVAVEIDYTSKTREDYRANLDYDARYKDPSDPFEFQEGPRAIAGLSDEMSDWIRDRAFELGWSEDIDFVMSPMGMAEMLLSDPCEDLNNFVLPIQDDYIQLLGRLAGAEIRSLEAPDEFFTYLKDHPDTVDAIIAVYAAYLTPVDTNAERATSFALYRQGRLGLMYTWDKAFLENTLGIRGREALARTDNYLLAYRNQVFLERISSELTEGGVVISVGSGHLPGPQGLVSMMRAAGYDVTRVPLPGEAE